MPRIERKVDHGDDALYPLRHSTAHLLAGAVMALFPDTKLGFGPPVANGFYYDFDLTHPLTPEDLVKIEAQMRGDVRANLEFVTSRKPAAEARSFFAEQGQAYKVDQIDKLEAGVGDGEVGLCTHGAFVDLCRGHHVRRTGELGHFKLLSVAGAYWRGDEKGPQLQRVYGTVWPTKAELDAHLARLAEAERRDHRRLGADLELFRIDEELGSGLVLWLPNGSVLREELETWWRQIHRERGYDLVYTPHIANERIYQRSGHLGKYGDNMYGPLALDQSFWLKPMNCPGHIKVFQSRVHSYRELPLRIGELGTVYRYERGGTLHGMLRVRGFTQDDSHIFCSTAQAQAEVAKVLDLSFEFLRTFGYGNPRIYLSTRPEKRLGTDAQWDQAEGALREALERHELEYEIDEGGGVFYAPKIDIKVLDAIGREWQGCTIQIDLNLPERFDVTFVNDQGQRERAVMIHRVLFGSMERFVGGLIEHFAGNFPLWLSPTQVAVIPVREDARGYADLVATTLRKRGFRVWLDPQPGDLRNRVKEATQMKASYALVVGAREAEARTVSVRRRGAAQGEEERGVALDAFVERLAQERDAKALPADFKRLEAAGGPEAAA
ncbi:MAG: threonine--tRNA ligase [Deltaproteobacteria bacterium]|nr:threonine--tRNA ligase [Deltaproteobacteria bacterium]